MSKQEMTKAIDAKIDDLFTEEEPVEKATEKPEDDLEKGKSQMDELIGKEPKKSSAKLPLSGDSKQTADEGESPKKAKNEEDGERGRPKDPSNMNKRDQYGDAKADYDDDYTAPAKKPAHETTVAKSEEKPETVTLSKEDFEVLKKAADAILAQSKQEKLEKVKEEQVDLIKSAVSDATKDIRDELKKSQEQNDELAKLVKSIGKRPRVQKSISNVGALEKGFVDESGSRSSGDQGEVFSKSEMVDAAEALVQDGQLRLDDAIELQSTGTLYNAESRAKVEAKLREKR